MRKKASLLILLVLAVFILTLGLVACGKANISKAPEKIGDTTPSDDVIDKASNTDEPLMLRFVFKQYMSSVFTAIPIEQFDATADDFNIGDYIGYQIVYAETGLAFDTKIYDLKMSMIDQDCIPLLSQPGKHIIRVRLELQEGKDPIEGSFTLHLSERGITIEVVTISFDLDGGVAVNFKSVGDTTTSSSVLVSIPSGTSFKQWEFFENTFLMRKSETRNGKTTNYIPRGIKSLGENKDYTEENITEENPLVFDHNETYKVLWREATIEVTFDQNLPAPKNELSFKSGSMKGWTNINNATTKQTVAMDTGTIERPNADDVNIFEGYKFAGWYYNDPDEGNKEKLWLFTQTVGRKNITLHAKWVNADYELKIFTMGADFKAGATSTLSSEDLANIQSGKLMYVASVVNFDLTTKGPNDILISGLAYSDKYSDYYTEIQLDADDENSKIKVRLDHLYDNNKTILEKAGGIFNLANLYIEKFERNQNGDQTKSVENITLDKISKDIKAYINWEMIESVKGDINALSNYYLDYAFKDGVSLKADGSLRIDTLFDASINELVVPAAIKWPEKDKNGNILGYVTRPISEIGDRALMNAKSLVVLDMSAAKNLTTIGARAFCYCQTLTTVILPTENNIEVVGEDAFDKTYWQEHYTSGNIIVLGTALYRYIGTPTASGVIDLTSEPFASDTQKTYSISSGCFVHATELKEIKLADNIDRINAGAFRGLANLDKVTVGASSQLYYIANAFEDCDKLVSKTNTNNVSDGKTVVIGKVLYRMLDESATSYEIPAGIEHIAPYAFEKCKSLATITFADEASIKTIGKDAFVSTVWINNSADGYVIVNGILAAFNSTYYTNVNTTVPYGSLTDPTVPKVTRISEYAYNTGARFIETIDIRKSVEYIESYAFVGASSIRSIIFSETAIETDGQGVDHIINLPHIEKNTFANSKGTLLSGLKLYFKEEVYDYFNDSANRATLVADYPEWADFFSLYADAFEEERIEKVYLNPTIQKERILDETLSSFTDDPNGIIAKSNSGINKYFALGLADNAVTFFKRVQNGDNVSYVEVGKYGENELHEVNFYLNNNNEYVLGVLPEGTYYVQFTFDGGVYNYFDADQYDEGYMFVINVHNAINSKPEPNTTLDGDVEREKAEADQNFWIETYQGLDNNDEEIWAHGFIGDLEKDGYPAFYTSHTTLDLSKYRFVYKDYTDAHTMHYLDIEQATGFTPNENNTPKVTLTVDFYGICNYNITLTYKGVVSLYQDIIQRDAIVIPLNGKVSTYLQNTFVYLKGQDGRETKTAFNLNTFDLVSVEGDSSVSTLPTDTLGMFTMRVAYKSIYAVDGRIEANIVYAVVLEPDSTVFSYEITNERDSYARITACSNTTSEALVVPNTYVDPKTGKKYTITEIGDGVFRNFSNLEMVYLPASLKKIGANAFENCTLLKEVYTATQTDYEDSYLSANAFKKLFENVTMRGKVVVTALNYKVLRALTVPEQLTWTETEEVAEGTGVDRYTFTRTTTYVADVEFDDDLFKNFNGTIWLFDNEYNRAYAEAHLSEKSVNFYDATSNRVPAANSRFIHSDFELYDMKDENGEVIYVDSNGIRVSQGGTAVKDINVERGAKLVTLEEITITAENNVFVLSDANTRFEFEDGIWYQSINIGMETEATVKIKATTDDFIVYLPSTIYTKCTLENMDTTHGNGVISIYQSGSATLVSPKEYAPSTLEYIGSAAFKGCVSLKEFTLSSDKLEDIGAMAFYGSGLKSLDLSDTHITEINNQVFANCIWLTEVKLPGGVNAIGASAFEGCIRFEKINYAGASTAWQSCTKGANWDYDLGVGDKSGTYKNHDYKVICSDTTITVHD